MRRIYDSEALERDDSKPHTPRERRREVKPQAIRWINSKSWSKRLVPHSIRHRAVSVRVETPDKEFEQRGNIPFKVTMKNRLPIPITIRTESPLPWKWKVNGHEGASHVNLRNPPDKPGKLHLDRGEREVIRRNWSGMFRVSEREWEPAESGEHTIRVEVNIENPERANLVAETDVQVTPTTD